MELEKNKIPTPHISAQIGDFAESVLMPGDPLRSKFIAENYLTNPILVNPVRGVNGYTGTYKGKRVSVMASGMGMPSMAIYSHELFAFYGVENIIRIGTCGALQDGFKVGDIIAAQSVGTNSNFLQNLGFPGTFSPAADFGLLQKAATVASGLGIDLKVGSVFTSDNFYNESDLAPVLKKLGVLAVEMEAAALYANAALDQKHALCLCSVADSFVTGEDSSSETRQNGFTKMMELALEIA